MRIGIDSYSYHRLLGEIRPGETQPRRSFPRGSFDAIDHARLLGVDGFSLETCFLGPRESLDVDALRAAAGPLELVLAWGHHHGLEFGASAAALQDLVEWLGVARQLGCSLVRCVAASPRFREGPVGAERIERTATALADAAAEAREQGLRLALENHGDLTAIELQAVLGQVRDTALGVCFDTANALRVGDDPLAATRLLAPRTVMVHVKDVEPLERVTDAIAGPCSVPYGEGVVPVEDVLAALDNAGFDGLVCVELGQLAPEADELDLVESCVAWLRGYASSNG